MSAGEIQMWDNLLTTVSFGISSMPAIKRYMSCLLNRKWSFNEPSFITSILSVWPIGRFWCQPICQQPGPSISAASNGLAGSWIFNFRPHLPFSHPRPCLGEWLPPSQLICTPNCNRASQRPTESLECSESIHTQFYYPRSHFDLSRAGQIKYDAFLHDKCFCDSLLNK